MLGVRCKVRVLLIFLFLLVQTCPLEAKEKEEYRFSLCLYHYNVQYVCGDKRIEDKIITESLEPVIDMYLRHPNWGADFEMQGYMIEVLGERHPQILKKLKTLVDRDQIDLVCFHYSDQLFLAFPEVDLTWSEKINQKLFKKYKLKRSPVVFTQEGQFGEGMAPFMLKHNYKIAIVAHNLYKYFHPQDEAHPAPYYQFKGIKVVLGGRSVSYEDKRIKIETGWSKAGDAEFVATGKNPYMKTFRYIPKILNEYERSLKEKEERGVAILKVSEYIKRLEELGAKPKPLKPILDCTWQPEDTDNFFLWMGGYRSFLERDVYIRSLNFQSRLELLAAERLIEYAQEKGQMSDVRCQMLDARREKLERGWKHQLLAEVSDSTGWFPFPVEIQYSIDESNKAMDIAKEIIEEIKICLNYKLVRVDIKTGKVQKVLKESRIPMPLPEVECPWDIKVEAAGLEYKMACYNLGGKRYDLKIDFIPSGIAGSWAKLSFKRKFDKIVYSPALMEDKIVEYPLEEFAFEYTYLPLPNGLIGLGKDVYLIKHNSKNHIAVRIGKKRKTVEIDLLNPPKEPFTYQFSLVFGDQEFALEQAGKINLYPWLVR